MDEQLYEIIGERIQTIRERRGLTQEELAANVGLSRASISNIERGRQKAPVHVLWLISIALGLSMANLLPDVDQLANGPKETQFTELDNLDWSEQDWVKRVLSAEGKEGLEWGH